MFAYAAWEPARRRLTLARDRDRLGIKPLCYARTEAGTVFGSEPKAVLAHPDVPVALDNDGFRELMLTAHPMIKTPGRSAFAGLREVAPGTTVVLSAKGETIHRYWTLTPAEHRDDLPHHGGAGTRAAGPGRAGATGGGRPRLHAAVGRPGLQRTRRTRPSCRREPAHPVRRRRRSCRRRRRHGQEPGRPLRRPDGPAPRHHSPNGPAERGRPGRPRGVAALGRAGRLNESDVATLARVVSAVLFLARAASVNATASVDEIPRDIRDQPAVVLPR